MTDKVLLIAACHHIIALTLVLCRYNLQTKQLVTHKPDEQSRKNKHCIVATISLLLQVQTASYKKWIMGVNQSEHEAENNLLV